MKSKVDVRFVKEDTKFKFGKAGRDNLFVAIDPSTSILKKTTQWLGIAAENATVARTLSKYFTTMAEAYDQAELDKKTSTN
jgi:hypothetical protein